MKWESVTSVGLAVVILVSWGAGSAQARQPFHPLSPKAATETAGPSPTPEQLRDATVPGNYDKPVVVPRISSAANGTHGLEAIAARAWSLVGFGDRPLAEGVRPPTIEFNGTTVSGFSGCNRYSGDVTETAPGVLSFGPLAGTRMACAPEAMEIEATFLATLQAVTTYALPNEKLVLSGTDRDPSRTLVFVVSPERHE